MAKIIRSGKVVVILSGKYAGKKALVIKTNDEGSKGRPYGHALVVGIERAPLKVTKDMSQKKIAKRSRVKPFVKVINFNHMMVTRYAVENMDFKNTLVTEDLKDPSKKKLMLKSIKKQLQDRYVGGANKWFFSKLRF